MLTRQMSKYEVPEEILSGVKAVIFDMDGTLVDSMWVWHSIDEECSGKYNLNMSEAFYKEIEGMSFSETARHFIDTFDMKLTQEEVMQEWTDLAYEKYTTKVLLKPGIAFFLEELQRRGIKMGIATSNGRVLVDATLKALHIEDYFQAVVTSCEVKKGKPAPDVYLKVAEKLEVNPEYCLVFEDVPNGILAGKNAGMRVCAVEDAYSEADRPKKKELADYYLTDYRQIENNTYEVLS